MKKLVYAVTGANGQIGNFLVTYLRSQDYIVHELVRSQNKVKDKKYYKFFDLTQPDQMPSLKGINVLIHTAYFFDTSDPKKYERINVHGTQILFEQAKIDEVNYIIFVSTLSAYAKACSLYGRTKYQLEQFLEERDAAVVRPGLVFHQPLQGIATTMDNFVKKYPIVPLIGSGKQLIYPCLLEDLAQLIFKLSIEQPKIKQPIIAASECPLTFKQLVQYLASQRQKNVLLIPLPFYGIYFILKFLEFLGLSIGLRSDSLLGLQYANPHIDFSESRKLGINFSKL